MQVDLQDTRLRKDKTNDDCEMYNLGKKSQRDKHSYLNWNWILSLIESIDSDK